MDGNTSGMLFPAGFLYLQLIFATICKRKKHQVQSLELVSSLKVWAWVKSKSLMFKCPIFCPMKFECLGCGSFFACRSDQLVKFMIKISYCLYFSCMIVIMLIFFIGCQRIAVAYLLAALCEIWLKADDTVNSGSSLLRKYRYQW